uniref:LSM domain-containing protein n=2 Tax=Aegilops tauschii subsp. strangulata TaxID=200361 RepID=A0A453SBJ3_AEGTS
EPDTFWIEWKKEIPNCIALVKIWTMSNDYHTSPMSSYFAEQDDPLKLSTKTRQLGLIVCRGTAVMLVSPTEGTEEIKNPFQEADGEQTAHS